MDQQDATARFYALVWPQAPLLMRTAVYLAHNHAEAEDIAQETFLKAFKSIGQFVEGTDIKSWLLTILRNTRIDRLRAKAMTHGTISLDAMAVEPNELGETGKTSENVGPAAWENPRVMMEGFGDREVIEALRQLPEDICWTLLLVDVEGLDHEVAAKILEVPVGTVKSRASRGRKMLHNSLLPLARELRLIL